MDNEYVSKKDDAELPLEISSEQISTEILDAIIESFIMREGTDYGVHEALMETKLNQVKKQIKNGDVKIIFEQSTETVSLITESDFKKLYAKVQSLKEA